MTMEDVIKGCLRYEVPVVLGLEHGFLGEAMLDCQGAKQHPHAPTASCAGALSLEIQPLARIAACRLIPRVNIAKSFL